jgi:hypothetical protein
MSVMVVRRCTSCGFSDESPAEDVVMVEDGTDDEIVEAFEFLRDALISKAGPRPCPTCERPGLDYSAVVRSVTASGPPN